MNNAWETEAGEIFDLEVMMSGVSFLWPQAWIAKGQLKGICSLVYTVVPFANAENTLPGTDEG